MRFRSALVAPLVVSVLGHLAVLSGLSALGGVPRRALSVDAGIPVQRATESAPGGDPRAPGRPDGIAAGDDSGAAAADVISIDTVDPRYRDYLHGVKRRIGERWQAPRRRAGEPLRGNLVIDFSLLRSGWLAAVSLREPSGAPALDRAALDAVRRAHPFAAFPAAIDREALTIRTRFVYE